MLRRCLSRGGPLPAPGLPARYGRRVPGGIFALGNPVTLTSSLVNGADNHDSAKAALDGVLRVSFQFLAGCSIQKAKLRCSTDICMFGSWIHEIHAGSSRRRL